MTALTPVLGHGILSVRADLVIWLETSVRHDLLLIASLFAGPSGYCRFRLQEKNFQGFLPGQKVSKAIF
jgi:hypothetical protein